MSLEAEFTLTFVANERDELFARQTHILCTFYSLCPQFVEPRASLTAFPHLGFRLGKVEVGLGSAYAEHVANGLVCAMRSHTVVYLMIGPVGGIGADVVEIGDLASLTSVVVVK